MYYEFFDYTLNLKQLENFFTLEVLIISTLQQLTLEGGSSIHAGSRCFGGEGEEDDSPFRGLSVSGGDLFTLGGGIIDGGLGWGGC